MPPRSERAARIDRQRQPARRPSHDQQVGELSRRSSTMLPRRLMGCLRLATVGSRAERLAFFRTSIIATGDRFSSTTSSAGRSSTHGESNGYKGNRRAPAYVDGSSVSGGRHITSTAVSGWFGRRCLPSVRVAGGATSAEVLVHCSACARHRVLYCCVERRKLCPFVPCVCVVGRERK